MSDHGWSSNYVWDINLSNLKVCKRFVIFPKRSKKLFSFFMYFFKELHINICSFYKAIFEETKLKITIKDWYAPYHAIAAAAVSDLAAIWFGCTLKQFEGEMITLCLSKSLLSHSTSSKGVSLLDLSPVMSPLSNSFPSNPPLLPV